MVNQFYNPKLWEEFSKTCKFREPKGYHWPEDNPYDACSYIDPETGGGIYTNCCYMHCLAYNRKDYLEEMDRSCREMERLDSLLS